VSVSGNKIGTGVLGSWENGAVDYAIGKRHPLT
jgi:hypothetical protein